MWLQRSVFSLLAVAVFLSTSGCGGYQFTGEPLVMPEGHRLLCIDEIDNPTMETWLRPMLRSMIRNELTRRGDVEWTSRAGADALLTVRIKRYLVEARIQDSSDFTLKKMVEIQVDAELTRTSDNTQLWQSGTVVSHETYLTDGELPAARSRAVEKAVRELADRMGHAF